MHTSPNAAPLVLIVDDTLDQLDMYSVALTHRGLRVRVAATAAEALQLATDEPPDVLVTDVHMPRTDGFELVRAVRASEAGARTPVIVVTADARPQTRLSMEGQFQPSAYLVKPCDLDVLADAIQRAAAFSHADTAAI